MRGRRRQSSAAAHYNSSVTQQQAQMTPRKQMIKDANAAPPGNQQGKEETQEDEVGDDSENEEELPSSPPSPTSSREKRRRQREKKSRVKEMTEEEMMDLALRLSEQEASAAALRLQQEQDAVMKAIQESMTQSQSLLTDADASSSLPPRRKLLYPNKQGASAGRQGASDAGAALEADLSQDLQRGEDQNNNQRKKRKRKEGSPLPEMPDLSQTQNVFSQASPFSSQSPSVPLDLQQDSDLTQIDQFQLRKSPVLPSLPPEAYKPEVHVTKLSQELLASCETSGFVLCSQDGLTSPHKPLPSQPESPTFPKSPACSESLTLSKSTTFLKSPASSETDQGEDGETDRSPEHSKSPTFGRTNENQDSLLAGKPEVQVCKLSQEPQVTCKTSGFILCSQESLTSSEKPLSLQPKSPVFPRGPGVSKNLAPSNSTSFPKSPVHSETDQGDDGVTQQSPGSSISPVFGRTSPVFGRTSPVFGRTPDTRSRPQCLTEGNGTDHDHGDEFGQIIVPSKSGCEEKPNEISKDWSSATELTSDITLRWSDEDEDVTQVVDSPSPVFSEEKPPHNQNASPNHAAAASPGTSGASCSLKQQRFGAAEEAERLDTQRRDKPSSSAASSSQQQRAETSTAEPLSGAAAPSAAPRAEPTVHYYWGVPFCPRGLDPDTYTRVIVAQMEVYEKSLKQAQRRLLRKAEWSEAILPQPEKSPSPSSPAESPQLHVPQRRGHRLRDKRPSEEPSAPPAEEEEGRKEDGEDEERERRKRQEEEAGGGGEADMSDCEVCPETQLSDNDDTQELIMSTSNGAEPQPKSPTLLEIRSLLRQWPPDQEQQQQQEEEEEEEMEVEVDNPVDRQAESSLPASNTNGGEDVRMEEEEEEERRRGPEAEQVQDGAPQMSVSPGPEAAAASQSGELRVDCPICQGSFPAAEIEMHAAYCDGEVEVVEELRPGADCYPASLRPRRKRSRRGEAAAEETADPSGPGRADPTRQRCYICQRAVPLKDYSRHTQDCMQHRDAAAAAPRGNLLSALERTESRDSEAGPSGSNFSSRAGDVIDLRFQEEEEESDSASAFRISSSPIRSFTPISEATDCLVDFKKQNRAKKPSQRRR